MQPSLGQLAAYFLQLGTIGFGGPIALVAYMRADLVERFRWFTPQEYDDGFAFSQAAPGPIAPQLAMYLAYLRYRALGSTVVILAFIFTPFWLVIVLSWLYVTYGGVGWIQSMLLGISPAVVAIVVHAVWKLGGGMLKTAHSWVVASAAFVLAILFHVELSFIIVGAGLLGISIIFFRKSLLSLHAVVLWPTVALHTVVQQIESSGGLLLKLALFFLKAGALTFGSGYVVVAFLQQGVVDQYQWLTVREFLDGVAIGQITPGPVVITAAFVGYLTEGFGGAFVSIASVLLPIYLITIVGSPLLRKYRDNVYVQGFIGSANAAALGTIASVAVAMLRGAVVDWISGGILIAVAFVLFRWNVPSVAVILVAGGIGLLIW